MNDTILLSHCSRVIDGDTIEIVTPSGTTKKVRLWGIDAPESDQPFGPVATEVLRDDIEGSSIILQDKGSGAYGRLLARVYPDEDSISVNYKLVRDGLAWASDYSNDDVAYVFDAAEAQARRRGYGLWQQDNPTAPWDHRSTPDPLWQRLLGLARSTFALFR